MDLDNQLTEKIIGAAFDPIFEAQLLTYLRVANKRVGLLINFNSRLLKGGVKRFVS